MRNILIKFIRDRISEKHSDQRYRLQTRGWKLDLPETGDAEIKMKGSYRGKKEEEKRAFQVVSLQT